MPLSSYTDYEYRCCPTCGIEYAVSKIFMENCHKDPNQWFHCPNGHRRHFAESEADKLRRERDRLQQQVAERDDQISAKEREIKRMKKRSAAGTCPCCQRTFSNMSTHMRKQHPAFVAEQVNVIPLKRSRR